MQQLVQASDQNLGHLEVQAAHDVRELLRQAVARGTQTNADATPPTCPVCGQPLRRLSSGHARTFKCRFGFIPVQRTRGYCKRCKKGRTPADTALGLEASAVLEHLTGLCLPRATLDREAKRQGQRAQALRRGLGQAAGALVLGDGAVWLWRLSDDRWPQARQRLDFSHAVQHLAAVGRALVGKDKAKLTAWFQPLVRQRKHESSVKVIRQLEEALAALPGGARATAVAREVAYFREQQGRMDDRAVRRAGEPIGSDLVEATCGQDQCRFKRPGQFWSPRGDEALLCLETFWRNRRWSLLFPHSAFHPAKNSYAPHGRARAGSVWCCAPL
ncbi:hypothetical protein [Limisphaera sp. VF-2]|uniref:hypothetical protein n=1 Tax=Limisphaera sp. VF-2 TaxID=3400418 RepID=UPI00176D6969